MSDREQELTAQARAEQEGVQGWVVSAYKTVFHSGVSILRGFGLPADETSRAFVTGAVTFAEQLANHQGIPDHVIDRTFDDCEKALNDGLAALNMMRAQIADERRDRAMAEAGDLDKADAPPTDEPTAENVVVPFTRDTDPGDESGSNGGGGGSSAPPVTH
jgi:hypothetical protein